MKLKLHLVLIGSSVRILSILLLYVLSAPCTEQKIITDVREEYNKMYSTKENNSSIASAIYGDFSLKAHHENFYLPLSIYSQKPYSYEQYEEYREIESHIQISFRFDLFYNIFGINDIFSLAYTQEAFWQNYTASSPFRETIYNPEAFFLFPLNDTLFKSLQFGYAHQSNGQGLSYNDDGSISQQNNRSRTWNYLYTTLYLQNSDILTELTLWARILKTAEDSTADLEDYIGYGSIKISYTPSKHWLKIMLRFNPSTGYGAVEGSYSYPMYWRDDLFWYVKIFDGYAQNLIDYNNHITNISLGISFSR